MKTQTTTALLALVAAAGTAFGQCSSSTATACQTEKSSTGTAMTVGYTEMGDNIVVTASKAGSFNTLLAAAKAAGLAEALMGDGPFTVFAPTDDAFAKLPKGTVESLLKPENKHKLAAILKYHVVSGELSARDVTRLSGVTSLNGQRINFASQNGGVRIDAANVVTANIECSNGVIHVIDSVILPAGDNIAEVAESAGMFSTLLTAAQAAGLVPALTGD
ncbi:MAG: fasciclin domain-containing protein, partial [Phycisphaerales bacterium JB041]